jgi:hypothetical protein
MSSRLGKSTASRGIEFDDDSSSCLDLKVVELQQSSSDHDHISYQNKCLAIAAALHDNGAVIIKDNRVSVTDNDAFIDMMERFVSLRHPRRLIDSQHHFKNFNSPIITVQILCWV